jgi:mono/diheme cytochrome c family protein
MMNVRNSLVVTSLLFAPVLWANELTNPDLISKGEYLSRAGDCVACHTAKGGKPYAGGSCYWYR